MITKTFFPKKELLLCINIKNKNYFYKDFAISCPHYFYRYGKDNYRI